MTTTTAHTVTVEAFAASQPGALSGHAARCTCGAVLSTSLSAQMATIEGDKHLDWHARTGR